MGASCFRYWLQLWCTISSISGTFEGTCDNLFIDMGGLLHDCLGKCIRSNLESFDKSIDKDRYFDAIIERLNTEILSLNPKMIYIAFDGVPPLAKLTKQKERRQKNSQLENRQLKNQLSPGTELMQFLSDAMKQHFQSRWQNMKVIFSDANVPGEAEHKIMTYIHEQSYNTHASTPIQQYIYSEDSDVILLALLTHDPHIVVYNRNEKWKMSAVRELLQTALGVDDATSHGYYFERFIEDFVFMALIANNDYLEMNAVVKQKSDVILNVFVWVYKDIFKRDQYLTQYSEVNYENFSQFIERVAEVEKEWLSANVVVRDRHYTGKHNLLANLEVGPEELNKNMARDYIRGLVWVWQLYITGQSCWKWNYPWPTAPLIGDNKGFEEKDFQPFEVGCPVEPIAHLLMVLPSSCSHYLPQGLQEMFTKYHGDKQSRGDQSGMNIHEANEMLSKFKKAENWEVEEKRNDERVAVIYNISSEDTRVGRPLSSPQTNNREEKWQQLASIVIHSDDQHLDFDAKNNISNKQKKIEDKLAGKRASRDTQMAEPSWVADTRASRVRPMAPEVEVC